MEGSYGNHQKWNSGLGDFMENSYIVMLEESLEKKLTILNRLQVLCQEQTDILSDEKSEAEVFEKTIEAKEELIEKLDAFDKAFDSLFAKVEKELLENREAYANEINHMQDLIRTITDKSLYIQFLEKQNYDLAKEKFSAIRSKIKKVRRGGKAVTTYYNNMNHLGTDTSQFWDKKH